MRYDVKKFLFIGIEGERDLFFKRAQEAGIIHFIDAKPAQLKVIPPAVVKIAQAIKILRGLPVVEQEETDDYELSDAITDQIISLKSNLDALFEEERIVRLDMSRVEIFGDFSTAEIAEIEKQTGRHIQFYCAKRGYAETAVLADDVLYVGSDHGLDYFMGINKEPVQFPKMIEMLIERPYGQLKRRHQEIEKEIHVIETHLKGFAKYSAFLHHAFTHKLNKYHLEEAKDYVEFPLAEQGLFAVQGWVPLNKLKALNILVEEMKVHVEEIGLDGKDVVPTCLENTGAARIGEDLVHIYDTPSNADKDPSAWVLVFFALFFSMIIGDGGYGLVLLIIALYVRYKHSNLHGAKRRMLDLLTILGFSCLVWGALTTSFFGITFAPDNPVRKVSAMTWLVEKKTAYHIQHKDDVYQEWVKKYPGVKDVKDPKEFLMKTASINKHGKLDYEAYNKFSDNIMMELALFVGVLHLIISMIRYLDRNVSHIGWIVFLIGAYLYVPFFLHATSLVNFVFGIDRDLAAHNGLYLVYGGIALAVIIALFRHKWFGLLEASNVIQIFGDVLSYLRLYALGLSGALLTATMNDLAGSVPFVFGIIILLFGHVVNITLGIMGGVIHGLRLNFLEWYHYSFEGGGKVYNPLRKVEIK